MCKRWEWALALALFVIWDIVSTLTLFHRGMIVEANPLLRGMIEHNPVGLVLVKIVPTGLLIYFANCWYLRLTFWLYLGLYCVGFLIFNH